jgi:hypothetical protein
LRPVRSSFVVFMRINMAKPGRSVNHITLA